MASPTDATLQAILAGLPPLAHPSRVITAVDAAGEARLASSVAAALDRRDVSGGDTALHLARVEHGQRDLRHRALEETAAGYPSATTPARSSRTAARCRATANATPKTRTSRSSRTQSRKLQSRKLQNTNYVSVYMEKGEEKSEVTWLRLLLEDFGVPTTAPTPLSSDSTGAISIARDPVKHELTKHIGVDASYMRSQVQLADFFTKAHNRAQHRFLLSKLSVVDPP
ncbi:unnamed protein product [Miscanthus lutarioriparius]|uniref:Uncharacterized protein n=1 Tax=Miscanthus lutarioriparius TaxID=422564 RepID=A0A811RVD9_9POAL|nr:unnamed protein product [Miscanthus lutarioriparius]